MEILKTEVVKRNANVEEIVAEVVYRIRKTMTTSVEQHAILGSSSGGVGFNSIVPIKMPPWLYSNVAVPDGAVRYDSIEELIAAMADWSVYDLSDILAQMCGQLKEELGTVWFTKFMNSFWITNAKIIILITLEDPINITEH